MNDIFKVKDNIGTFSLFTPDYKEVQCEILSIQKRKNIGPAIALPGIKPLSIDTVVEFSMSQFPIENIKVDKTGFFLVIEEKRYKVNEVEVFNGGIRVEVFAEIIP